MTTEATTDPVGAARAALAGYLAKKALAKRSEERYAATGAQQAWHDWDAVRFHELLAARDLADTIAPLLAHVAALEALGHRGAVVAYWAKRGSYNEVLAHMADLYDIAKASGFYTAIEDGALAALEARARGGE